MRRKKLLKILDSKLSQQMQEVSIKARRYLAVAPQRCKAEGWGNYEKTVIPELKKIYADGYEVALNEGIMILSNHLRFSCQKKPFLEMYLKVAEQQSSRIFHLISENERLSSMTESSSILVNLVSKNLVNLTKHKMETMVLKSISLVELITIVLSVISILLTVLFGVISLMS